MLDVLSLAKLREYVANQQNVNGIIHVARGDEFYDDSDEETAQVAPAEENELGLELEPMDEGEEEDYKEDLSEVIYENVSLLQAAYLVDNHDRVFELLENPHIDPNHIFYDGKSQDVRLDMGGDGIFLEKMTLLHLAVLDGNEEVVRRLCKDKRVNVNATANVIPNKHLYYKYDTYLEDGSVTGIDEYDKPGLIANMWISRDVVQIKRICGVTPLHLAFRVCNQAIVDALVEAGGDLNALDSNKDDPLDYLEQSQRDFNQAKTNRTCKPLGISEPGFESLTQSVSKLPIRRFKPRLLLGEADFSFSAALLRKHYEARPGLGRAIVATELEPSGDLYKNYKKFHGNMQYLYENKATLFYGFDARHIHDDPRLTLARYPRIHFNCPYQKNPKIEPGSEKILQNIIADFFKSASQKQEMGDRIHMALPKESDPGKRQFREAYLYGIFKASAEAGYRLIKKRKFGSQRYPGYQHRKTGVDVSVSVTEDSREYIFEKTPLSYQEIRSQKPPILKKVYGFFYEALPYYDTDNDSSNYEEPQSAPALKKQCMGTK